MAIRHTKGVAVTTEREIEGSSLDRYSIEEADVGPRIFYSDYRCNSVMPREQRHTHGGAAGSRQMGYSSKAPSYRLFNCIVPECTVVTILPCRRLQVRGDCSLCSSKEGKEKQ